MYEHDEINDADNTRATKLPGSGAPRLTKYGEVKAGFEFIASTPGKLRRGVARHGDGLRGFTDYNLKLHRSDDDKRWTLFVEWVDLDGEGHRVVFPHEVVAGVLQRANSIIAQCRSERAKNAALTRKQKGIVPFQPKEARAA